MTSDAESASRSTSLRKNQYGGIRDGIELHGRQVSLCMITPRTTHKDVLVLGGLLCMV